MIRTLRDTEELEKVGFTTEQAKQSVQIWTVLMQNNFATKSDIKNVQIQMKNLKNELQIEMKKLRTELHAGIKNPRADVYLETHSLKTEFQEFKIDFLARFDELERNITIKFGVMVTAYVVILAALITYHK